MSGTKAAAKSMFNDTFTILRNGVEVAVSDSDISWPADQDSFYGRSMAREIRANRSTISSWRLEAEADSEPVASRQESNNGATYGNERFRGWIRTAALADFWKMWGKIDAYNGRLPDGNYTLQIEYSKSITQFITDLGESPILS